MKHPCELPPSLLSPRGGPDGAAVAEGMPTAGGTSDGGPRDMVSTRCFCVVGRGDSIRRGEPIGHELGADVE